MHQSGVSRLLEEASLIVDPELRTFTQIVLCASAEDNWRGRSGWNHHLEDERGEWGNYLHTVRVLRVADTLAELLNLEPYKRDVLRSAALLHDSCKRGVNAEGEKLYTRTHARLVGELVAKAEVDYHPDVRACIEQHMGRWGEFSCDWRSGAITLPFLLHVADCVESNLPDVLSVRW